MARDFTEGFELGDGYFWNNTLGGAISSSTKRTGTYSWQLTGTCGRNITATSEFYMRFAVYMTNADNTAGRPSWRNSTTTLGSMRFAGSRLLAYVSTGTLVATGATLILENNWYVIEIYVKIADANGRIVIKIDGNTEIDYTGDTKPSTQTTVDNILFGGVTGTFIDDLALNNVTGGADNSWCGDGQVFAYLPNGNGDSSQLTGSDGNTTDNYLLVDETPNDGNTTYVESSNSGDKDLYAIADATLGDYTISRVWVDARGIDTVAAVGQINLGIKPSGGSEDWSAALSLLTTYTKQLNGTVYTVNPLDSAAWEDADIDGLQIGVKVV